MKITVFKQSIFAMLFVIPAYSMHQEHQAETLVRGGVVGIAEGITGVPCTQIKNHLQAHKPLREFPVAGMYRGFGVNAFAAGPATVVQYGIHHGLQSVVDDSRPAQYCTAIAAGIAGATVAAPSEALVMHAMHSKNGFVHDARSIVRAHGVRGLQRGFVPTAVRDAVWAAGYFAGPKDTTAATVATGVVVAAVSHPFDTIKTHMQSNVKGGSFKHVARALLKDSPQAAFKGAVPRTIRVIAALLGMSKADEACRAVSEKIKTAARG